MPESANQGQLNRSKGADAILENEKQENKVKKEAKKKKKKKDEQKDVVEDSKDKNVSTDKVKIRRKDGKERKKKKKTKKVAAKDLKSEKDANPIKEEGGIGEGTCTATLEGQETKQKKQKKKKKEVLKTIEDPNKQTEEKIKKKKKQKKEKKEKKEQRKTGEKQQTDNKDNNKEQDLPRKQDEVGRESISKKGSELGNMNPPSDDGAKKKDDSNRKTLPRPIEEPSSLQGSRESYLTSSSIFLRLKQYVCIASGVRSRGFSLLGFRSKVPGPQSPGNAQDSKVFHGLVVFPIKVT